MLEWLGTSWGKTVQDNLQLCDKTLVPFGVKIYNYEKWMIRIHSLPFTKSVNLCKMYIVTMRPNALMLIKYTDLRQEIVDVAAKVRFVES